MKNILLAGGAGYIGSHTAVELLKSGYGVVIVDNLSNSYKTVIDRIESLSLKRVKFYELDTRSSDLEIVFQENNIDVVVDFAAYKAVGDSVANPLKYYDNNLLSLINMMTIMSKYNVQNFVFSSSATVYGSHFNAEFTAKEEDTYKADALHTPNTPYSESKRMAEVMAGAYHAQYGVDVLIVRIAYVYGYAKHKPNTAFYEFINKALEGSDIVINNSGMGKRDNIYVEDVVDALLLLANKELAEDKIQLKIAAENKERKPGLRLDNQKLKSLGWSPQFSLEAGIREILIRYMH